MMRDAAGGTEVVEVRLPKVSDQTVWKRVRVQLDGPVASVRWVDLGWSCAFFRMDNVKSCFAPDLTPAPAAVRDDIVLSAGFTFLATDDQYWVPVSEVYRRALLFTPRWTIVIQRVPSP